MVFVGIDLFFPKNSFRITFSIIAGFVNYSKCETKDTGLHGAISVGSLVLCMIIESFSHRHFYISSRRLE